jgi:hypothetical protein
VVKTEEKLIGEHTYRVTQVPFKSARKVLLILGRVLTPAVEQLGSSAKGGQVDLMSLDLSTIGAALSSIFNLLSEKDLDYVTDVLAKQTTVVKGDAEPPLHGIINIHFTEFFGEYTPWLVFALKVNFADFFGGAGVIIGARARAQSQATNMKSPYQKA